MAPLSSAARATHAPRYGGRPSSLVLLVPAVLLMLALVAIPLIFVLRVSLLAPGPGASLEGPLSGEAYLMLADPYLIGILLRTVRVAVLTTAGCLLVGYPLALALAGSSGRRRTVLTGLVVSPLLMSVVVRGFGWTLLLGRQGLVNKMLVASGLVAEPVQLLQTEFAVVVGLVEALLPFMVLALVASLDQIDRALIDAARGLGDSAFGAFWRITLPLSRAGALGGSVLVFMVAMSSYATPAMLGGARVRLMVSEIYTQVTSVFDWPLAAALSMLLLLTTLVAAVLAPGLKGGAA